MSAPDGRTPAGGRGAGDGHLRVPGGESPIGRPPAEGLVGEGVAPPPVAEAMTRQGDGIDRVPERPERRELPPAKGDSDLRGQTPDDMEPPADALLVVRGLKKYFPIRKGLFNRHVGDVKAVDGVSFFAAQGRDAGDGGRVGVRQEHHGPRAAQPDRAHRGRGAVLRAQHLRDGTGASCGGSGARRRSSSRTRSAR